MNQAIVDNFMARPVWQRTAIWVGSLVFILFIFWSYFYKSKQQELEKLSGEIEKLNAEITKETRIAKNLDKFRKEVKELDVMLKFALQELPDKKEIPDLLSSVSNLAKDAGLQVGLFKPGPEQMREFYAEVPVAVSVQGTYHQVAAFFDEVGHLPRIVNINQIKLKEPKISDERIALTTDCVATTFRYLDESERLAMAERAKKGGKKGKRGGAGAKGLKGGKGKPEE